MMKAFWCIKNYFEDSKQDCFVKIHQKLFVNLQGEKEGLDIKNLSWYRTLKINHVN